MRGNIREYIWPWMSAAVLALVALVTAIGCGDKPKPVDDGVDVEVKPDGRGGRIKVDIDKDGRPVIDVDIKRGSET